jgi:hypothetical protein
MKTMRVAPCSVALSLAFALASGGEVADFARYQVIVDKNLFGEPVEPTPPPAAQQPPPQQVRSFADSLRISGVIQERDGAWVALVDVGSNPNKSSLTKVGEENPDGVMVVSADVEGGKVLVKKGDEEKLLSLEQPSTAPQTPPRSSVPGPHGFTRTPLPVPAPATHTVNTSASATSSTTLAERLKARREALERAKAAVTSPPPPVAVAPTNISADVTPQERMKKLREYNLELIRARGAKGPPLPIQLTPEEDEQLVKEGVLAPQTSAPVPSQ